MVITPIDTIPVINTSQGQLITKRVRFQADEDLTGKTVYFNPAIYTPSIITSAPSSAQYSVVYPAIGVRTQMTFLGPPSDKNYEAAIEVIDANTFDIYYSFFVMPDQGGFQPDFSIANSSFPNPQALSGVYLGFFVSIDGDTAQKNVPIYGNRWCTSGAVEWALNLTNGSSVDGYVLGQDLVVNFNINGSVSSNYFVGVFRRTGIGNNADIITDLELSYALINGSVTPVADAANNVINSASIIAGTSINQSGTLDPAGSFTIDGNYFISGRYVVYVVYQEGSEWKSCLLNIRSGTIQECVYGDVTTTITDSNGNSIAADIGVGLSESGEVTVAVAMDKTSYNTNLAAAGLIGDYDTNFQGIESTVNGATLNATNDVVTLTVNPNGLAQIVTIGVTFIFLVEGEFHRVTKEIRLDFGVTLQPITGVVQDSSGNEVTIICEESPDTYTFIPTVAQTYDQVFSNLNGGTYGTQLVNNALQLNSEGLVEGDVVCVQLVESGTIDTTDCECPACGVIPVTVSTFLNPQTDEVEVEVSVPSNGALTVYEAITDSTTTGSSSVAFGLFDQNLSTLQFTISFTDGITGCEYQLILNLNRNEFSNYEETHDMDIITSLQPTCDCPDDETQCSNSFSFITSCNESTQEINVSVNDSFASTIDTETITAQVDGAASVPITFPYTVTASEVIIVRKIVFTDGCTAEATQRIECEEVDTTPTGTIACDYSSYSVLCSYDSENNLFTVATTGDTSLLSLNNLTFSLNGSQEIPYLGGVNGKGLFVAYWDIQKNGCPPQRITSYCSVLDCCNSFEFDCEEDSECDLTGGTLSCVNGILSFTPNASELNGWTFAWSGSIDGALGTGLSIDLNPYDPQTITLDATHPTCASFSDTFEWLGPPSAGTEDNPEGNPIIIN